MAPPQRQVGLYNRRTELKTLDATISAKFSTTANFTLFNAVRLGPDDFQRVGKEIKMHSLFLKAVLLIVLLQPELVIVLIFCVCWSFTTVRVMAHYLQFLTFLLCVILLVLLLPLQDHQEMMIIKTDSKFFWIVAEYE